MADYKGINGANIPYAILVDEDGNPVTVAPSGGAVVTDGESVDIKSADDATTLFTGTANVAGGSFNDISAPGDVAVLTDGQASIDIDQFDDTGSFAASVAVAANVLTVKLSNATTRIGVNAGPIQVTAGAKTVGATIAIDQGAYQPFPLSAATDAIVSDTDAIQIENVGSTQNVAGALSVTAGVALAKLPANTAMVADGGGIQVPVTGTYTDTITPQVDANGAITGFTLS